jgi:hypothetical protein
MLSFIEPRSVARLYRSFQRLRNWIIGKVQTQQLFFPAQNLFLISSSLIDQR